MQSGFYKVPVKIIDFRKVVFDNSPNKFGKSKRTDSDYLMFCIAKRSWLEPITRENNVFRVTNYNPDNMAKSHQKGKHCYCVARDVFDAYIVITIPKTKTHRMACMTNTLKNLVGINGEKDYLSHHRIGSKDPGGDCYKTYNILRSITEKLLDFTNRHKGGLCSS